MRPFALTANKILLLIILLSLGLRFYFLYELQKNPSLNLYSNNSDSYIMEMAAKSIVDHSANNYYLRYITCKPYLYFIVFCYKYFSNNWFLTAQILQSFISLLGIVFLYLAGKRLYSAAAGLIAAGLFAFYNMSVLFTAVISYTTFASISLIYAVYAIVLYAKNPDNRNFLMTCAALILVSIFVRTHWGFFIFFVVYDSILHRRFKTKFFIVFLALAAGLGTFTFTRTYYSSGHDFMMHAYFGNNEITPGILIGRPDIRKNIVGHQIDVILLENNPTINPSNNKNYLLYEIINFAKNKPLRFFNLTKNKILLLFNAFEIDNITCLYYYKKYCNSMFLAFISFGLVFPLALYGFIRSISLKMDIKLLYFFFLFQALSNIVIFIADRYRFQLLPVILLMASFGVIELYKTIASKDAKKYLYAFVIILSGLILTNLRFDFLSKADAIEIYEQNAASNLENDNERVIIMSRYRSGLDTDYQGLFDLGTRLKDLNLNAEAEEVLTKALERTRSNAEKINALEKIAYAREDMYDLEKALSAWEMILALDGDNPVAIVRTMTIRQYLSNLNGKILTD